MRGLQTFLRCPPSPGALSLAGIAQGELSLGGAEGGHVLPRRLRWVDVCRAVTTLHLPGRDVTR